MAIKSLVINVDELEAYTAGERNERGIWSGTPVYCLDPKNSDI